jgi:uncharacterized damage-inducible protein DinB
MANQSALHSGATPAYADAMMKFLGDREPLEVFASAPGEVRKAVAGLSAKLAHTPEAPGKWSVAAVVQHLADVEIVLGLRYRRVLAQPGQSVPAIDQDALAAVTDYNNADIAAALDDYEAVRRANVRLLRTLTPAQLELAGIHEERGRETLGHMIRLYAAHDCYHVYQIERIKKAIGA